MPSIEEEKHNPIVDGEDLESEDEDDDDEVDDDEEDLESDDEIDEDDDEIDEEHPNPTQPPLKQEHQLLHQQLHQQLHQPPPVTTPTPTPTPTPPPPAAGSAPVQKPHTEEKKPLPSPLPIQQTEEKKPLPLPLPIDDSRRLFQRLWTDEDEIGLLQGFYEYTSQRGGFKSSAYHHDTAPFYDQIKSRLQLDFNKSQLVEKLRRLKKKYRNAMARVNSGKDLSFKTAHDQATFEISKKIWCDIGGTGIEDEDHAIHAIPSDFTLVNGTRALPLPHPSSASSSRKRPRTTTTPLPIPTPITVLGQEENVADHTNLFNSSLPNMIEETVKNCLGPLFKELMQSAVNGRTFAGLGLNPLGMNFGGNSPMNFLGGIGEKEMIDEKWRKQQIMELEVYSKRVELVQEQIKVALEELRSNGNE